jgi:ParB family chromosome partitioning protein
LALEPKRRLGRGLDALLGAYPQSEPELRVAAEGGRRTVPIDLIDRNPRNPRRDFDDAELAELTDSVKRHGIVQPIAVRPVGDRYELIAGERRWRAAQRAGLHDVPVTILDVSDREALEVAIVENVQRADLNPIEEARGYQALIDEFKYTQADLGDVIGKSRVHVTNTLRLLKLPHAIIGMLEKGEISAGHGRALLASETPEKLAKLIVAKGLSVREAERLTQPREAKKGGRRSIRNADIAALEKELSDTLGMKVAISHEANGSGDIRIAYRNLEQFELVCRKLRRLA